MEPGQFRHRVEIFADVGTTRGLQGNVPEPRSVAAVWCKIEPIAGNEYWRAAQSESSATHRVTMRFDPKLQLSSRHWLRHKGRRFDVDEVLDVEERHEFLQLLVHEHEEAAG